MKCPSCGSAIEALQVAPDAVVVMTISAPEMEKLLATGPSHALQTMRQSRDVLREAFPGRRVLIVPDGYRIPEMERAQVVAHLRGLADEIEREGEP